MLLTLVYVGCLCVLVGGAMMLTLHLPALGSRDRRQLPPRWGRAPGSADAAGTSLAIDHRQTG
ncbi:MAG: hypothetical protein ACRDZQ_06810 [Acidimicrobiales bacterium]